MQRRERDEARVAALEQAEQERMEAEAAAKEAEQVRPTPRKAGSVQSRFQESFLLFAFEHVRLYT